MDFQSWENPIEIQVFLLVIWLNFVGTGLLKFLSFRHSVNSVEDWSVTNLFWHHASATNLSPTWFLFCLKITSPNSSSWCQPFDDLTISSPTHFLSSEVGIKIHPDPADGSMDPEIQTFFSDGKIQVETRIFLALKTEKAIVEHRFVSLSLAESISVDEFL